MEKNDVEIISSVIISEESFKPRLEIIWLDKLNSKFFKVLIRVSTELIQDMASHPLDKESHNNFMKEVIMDNLQSLEKVDIDFILDKYKNNAEIMRHCLSHIRNEKLNKLI